MYRHHPYGEFSVQRGTGSFIALARPRAGVYRTARESDSGSLWPVGLLQPFTGKDDLLAVALSEVKTVPGKAWGV
ncbi:hypothetical protein DTO164E3_1677 [Paecilomyces variotii]|nr:hypothetical protein DTO164E3_1677 [Paecilomyces variotii]KAJ9207049.1 hypothetical protein DTO032I3_1637 [Paecilomyces variotii]KAJ9275770.1 hypothetical protein DTO021D3_7407 [Paecilomyces variotii]KAJ9338470.1 hypothetical protein DTO027B6_8981 [Paecilomyces variotii]KAJ9377191.1 hypothetical protein DTO032I4_8242 [Paecilomyces variotii]